MEAYALYIIPEVSKEDEQIHEAAQRNEEYDPCTDDSLTLEQITKYIYDQDAEIKSLFKKGKSLTPDSAEKKELDTEISDAKAKLRAYLQKEK